MGELLITEAASFLAEPQSPFRSADFPGVAWFQEVAAWTINQRLTPATTAIWGRILTWHYIIAGISAFPKDKAVTFFTYNPHFMACQFGVGQGIPNPRSARVFDELGIRKHQEGVALLLQGYQLYVIPPVPAQHPRFLAWWAEVAGRLFPLDSKGLTTRKIA